MIDLQTIVIASDHAGFKLKEELKQYLRNYKVIDLGCNSDESVNYPDYAHTVAAYVLEHSCRGILICGSGIGMSIAANRHQGIRAALCPNPDYAKLSREHNDSNILVLGSRFLSVPEAIAILDTWLQTEFLGERHQTRVKLIDKVS